MFFNKEIKNHRIDSFEQKRLNLIKEKLDFLIVQKFNKKFSNINYKTFISKILSNKIKCNYIYVSKNFRFGNKREGNVKKLKHYEKKYSFKTIITNPIKSNAKTVSSTIIRNLLKRGNLKKANYLLNRKWEIEGKVIKGAQRGRKIGFPTCNIILKNYIIPKFGVYAVNVKINKTTINNSNTIKTNTKTNINRNNRSNTNKININRQNKSNTRTKSNRRPK